MLHLLFDQLLVRFNSSIALYLQFCITKLESYIILKDEARQNLNNIIKAYKQYLRVVIYYISSLTLFNIKTKVIL